MSQPFTLPNRQTIRLQSYDYSSEGAYFITIVTENRISLFGKIIAGKMLLNQAGKIAEEEWLNTKLVRPNISLGEFIIMPDHMHMILHIDFQNRKDEIDWNNSNPKSPSHTIGAIIRGFKGACTKRINILLNHSTGELQFAPTELHSPTDLHSFTDKLSTPTTEFIKNKIWQRNYYEHIIRNQSDYDRIEKYIIQNPENFGKKKKK